MSIFGTVVRLVQIQLHIHHFFSHIPHNAIMSSNRTCLIPERERERRRTFKYSITDSMIRQHRLISDTRPCHVFQAVT